MSTFPLILLQLTSFLIFLIWNSLRNEEVPTIASGFNSFNFFLSLVNKISLGSFLSKNVLVSKPSVSIAGRSFSA